MNYKLEEIKQEVRPCVYILKTSGKPTYVGKTKQLEKRLRSHFSNTNKDCKGLKLFCGSNDIRRN